MTTKITKSLLEAVSNVITGKTLTEASDMPHVIYLDKNNVEKKSLSNLDQFEAFVIPELADVNLDSEDAETLFDLIKKGYKIAAQFKGGNTVRDLKKNGFKETTAGYHDEEDRLVSFWVKAPGAKNEEVEEGKEKEEDEGKEESGDDEKNQMTEAAKDIPTNADEFMDWFDKKYNSAAGMWLSKNKIPQLMKIVKSKTVKTVMSDEPLKAKSIETNMKAKGFTLFAWDDNDSSIEFIFYK